MSLSDQPNTSASAGGSVCVNDLPGPDKLFVESYVPKSTATPAPNRLPRSWDEVERMVEKRLAQFEDRHLKECEQSFERGIQEGFRQQEETLQKKLEAAATPIEAAAARLDDDMQSCRGEIYSQSAALASAVVSQWLVDLVSINPDVFASAMRDALEPLRHLDSTTIRLHPEDYETLREGLQRGDHTCAEFGSVNVVPDPKVERGGAISTSEGGSVDARLETRIQRSRELLRIRPLDS